MSVEKRIADILEREIPHLGTAAAAVPPSIASIASVLAAELGLAREWCARHESGGGGIYDTEEGARQFLANLVERPPAVEDPGSGRYVGLESRYVTNWARVE